MKVLFDHTAVLAAGAGHRQLSYAIHDTGRRGGEILVGVPFSPGEISVGYR